MLRNFSIPQGRQRKTYLKFENFFSISPNQYNCMECVQIQEVYLYSQPWEE